MNKHLLQTNLTFAGNRRSYLLRLWRENGRSPWRIMLQSTDSTIRQNFVDIHTFFEHLEELMDDEHGGDL